MIRELDHDIPPDQSRRRIKVFNIDTELFERFILGPQRPHQQREWVLLEGIDGVNDGRARILSVEWSMMAMGFEVVVWHPSFPVIDGSAFTNPERINLDMELTDANSAEGQAKLRPDSGAQPLLRRLRLRNRVNAEPLEETEQDERPGEAIRNRGLGPPQEVLDALAENPHSQR